MERGSVTAIAGRLFTRRRCLVFVLLLHFGVILVQNLPPNAFRTKVEPYFGWYLDLTGLQQHGWVLFASAQYQEWHFELGIPDGPGKPNHYRFQRITDAREFILLDAFSRNAEAVRERQIREYLRYKRRLLGMDERYMKLQQFSHTVTLGESPPDQKLLVNVWELEPDAP